MRARWLSGRALGFHALVVVVVAGCLLAGRWQLHAALGGNTLSWAYTVEWPIFAVIAVVGWWYLVHEEPAERAERAHKAAQDADRQRKRIDGEPSPGRRRSWQEATLDAYGWEDVSEVDTDRVAAAAREEYLAHLSKLAARNEAEGWHWRKARGLR